MKTLTVQQYQNDPGPTSIQNKTLAFYMSANNRYILYNLNRLLQRTSCLNHSTEIMFYGASMLRSRSEQACASYSTLPTSRGQHTTREVQ